MMRFHRARPHRLYEESNLGMTPWILCIQPGMKACVPNLKRISNASGFDVLAPVVLFAETQYLANFPVGEQGLVFAKVAA